MKIDYAANRKWQENSRQRQIEQQKNKPRSSLSSSSMPTQRKAIKKESVKGKVNRLALAEIKKELQLINPFCWRCGASGNVDLHHKAGRVGWRMLYKPLLCLLCRTCHMLCDSDKPMMRGEGWLLSIYEDYRNDEIDFKR